MLRHAATPAPSGSARRASTTSCPSQRPIIIAPSLSTRRRSVNAQRAPRATARGDGDADGGPSTPSAPKVVVDNSAAYYAGMLTSGIAEDNGAPPSAMLDRSIKFAAMGAGLIVALTAAFLLNAPPPPPPGALAAAAAAAGAARVEVVAAPLT